MMWSRENCIDGVDLQETWKVSNYFCNTVDWRPLIEGTRMVASNSNLLLSLCL